jgi:hypothetical protein
VLAITQKKTSDISKKNYKTTLAWHYLKGRIIYREEEGRNKILIRPDLIWDSAK